MKMNKIGGREMSNQKHLTVDNYINGTWSKPLSGEYLRNVNPANLDEVVGETANSNVEDLECAISAALEVKKNWRVLSSTERGNYLYKVASIMEQRANEIGEMMTREMGKTLGEAKGEVLRGVAILRYYAGEGMRPIGNVIPATDASALMYTSRVPLGVVAVISPWNFPVAIPVWKIAPALVYGNTVVWKPASEAAITASLVMACFHDAGLPAGVLNMIVGPGRVIGQKLAEHKDVQGITFTGSNQVGRLVGIAAASRGAKYQLEMGGKNPIIIAADADLNLAVDATISGGLRSTGQKCTATSRVIVDEEVYDEFRELLINKVKHLKLGDGLDSSTWLGPCANEKQYKSVRDYIEKGIAEGAKIVSGDEFASGLQTNNGYFVAPVIFDEVSTNMTIAKEEIFGPVLCLIKASSFDEAIELANDTQYGLSASIYTRNLEQAFRFVNEVDAGMVRVNAETAGVELQAPFGGMKSSSSHSREQGQAAVEFYTAIKTVFVKP